MAVKRDDIIILKETTNGKSDASYVQNVNAKYGNTYNGYLHYHDYFELEYVVSGSGRYEINSVEYEMKAGMLFLTTPADYHRYIVEPGEEAHFYNLQFFSFQISEMVSSQLFSSITPIALHLSEEEAKDCIGRFERVFRASAESKNFSELFIRNEIENMCIVVARKIDSISGKLNEHPMIKSAIIYAKDHYREDISLKNAAEHIGLSPSYFSYLFKKSVGINYFDYLRTIRLEMAANLLKSTDLQIKEICYKTGFTNPDYFTAAFKSHFGMSPREYRTFHLNSIFIKNN